MNLKSHVLLIVLMFCAFAALAKAQMRSNENWRDIAPQTVTLYSRTKYQDKFEGYGKSTFSFKHGVRSDAGGEITRNNYELQYGNYNINGDSDWFDVTMVTDDCSRIKDLGELNWSDVFDVPFLPATVEPQQGVTWSFKSGKLEKSSGEQVSKVIVGHIYAVHSKYSSSDFYTLFRVEKLVPSDEVTISWKPVPSPKL